MKATFKRYTLKFKQASGTSRGVYTSRDSWFIFLTDGTNTGIGECAPLPDLSVEDLYKMSWKLLQVCQEIDFFIQLPEELHAWPSIRFGLETALLDLANGGKQILFPSAFTRAEQAIPINGLIWMGTPEFMKQQIRTKLEAGFRCIKLKIGALDFETEIELLKAIRSEFSPEEITLRVDANGAYSYQTALENMKRLSELQIHSIEQPIEAGRWNEMAELCSRSPVPIGLDEELIGISTGTEMQKLMETIRPAYLILKPSLHGGFAGCEKWIEQAEKNLAGWWVTSALESNIGLNAIAQWTFQLKPKAEQGLGTGQLFTNNLDSPLETSGQELWYRPEKKWNLENLSEQPSEMDL
ncbi:MAG TPA: o-succinylbenzoate synthase [Prolixibacteraceae bacterium]|nr:o-succinylbenzoate synthase [Prolixibacteraceae bacterium]